MHNRIAVLLAAFCGVWVLSACHRAESPAQVDKDVTAARERAAKDTQKAEQTAQEKLASARSEVQSAQRDAAHVSAQQAQNVEDTDADGAQKVALAKCEALKGDAQKSCRDKADADYQLAKARAEQLRVTADPKP